MPFFGFSLRHVIIYSLIIVHRIRRTGQRKWGQRITIPMRSCRWGQGNYERGKSMSEPINLYTKMLQEYVTKLDIMDMLVDYYGEIARVPCPLLDALDDIEPINKADIVEVGKAYPRGELEKYGLSEWKDKHGQRWVMVERREHESDIHD